MFLTELVFSSQRISVVVQEDGTVSGWRTADYLFSEDAACPDTVR